MSVLWETYNYYKSYCSFDRINVSDSYHFANSSINNIEYYCISYLIVIKHKWHYTVFVLFKWKLQSLWQIQILNNM